MARIRPVSHSRDAQSVLGSRISKQSTSRHKGSLRRLSRKPHPHALPTVITRAAGRALASSVLPENVEVQDNELPLSHSTTELPPNVEASSSYFRRLILYIGDITRAWSTVSSGAREQQREHSDIPTTEELPNNDHIFRLPLSNDEDFHGLLLFPKLPAGRSREIEVKLQCLLDTGCRGNNLIDLRTVEELGIPWERCKPVYFLRTPTKPVMSHGWLKLRCNVKPGRRNSLYVKGGRKFSSEVFQVVDLSNLEFDVIISLRTMAERNWLWSRDSTSDYLNAYREFEAPVIAEGVEAERKRQENIQKTEDKAKAAQRKRADKRAEAQRSQRQKESHG